MNHTVTNEIARHERLCARLDAKEATIKAVNRAKFKAKGYSFRLQLVIWKPNADPVIKVHYFRAAPSDARIRQLFEEYGSTVFTDFTVESF